MSKVPKLCVCVCVYPVMESTHMSLIMNKVDDISNCEKKMTLAVTATMLRWFNQDTSQVLPEKVQLLTFDPLCPSVIVTWSFRLTVWFLRVCPSLWSVQHRPGALPRVSGPNPNTNLGRSLQVTTCSHATVHKCWQWKRWKKPSAPRRPWHSSRVCFQGLGSAPVSTSPTQVPQ